MNALSESLAYMAGGAVPPSLAARMADVDGNYREFLKRWNGRPSSKALIYGLNTLPGHLTLDQVETSPAEIEAMLLRSHTIGGPPFFSREAGRAISAAKAFSIAALGPIVSGETFRTILGAMADGAFEPSIPALSSYSSGDVIPGAHWLDALLEWANRHQPLQLGLGEAMALINGAYVHVGATLDLIGDIGRIWSRLIAVSLSSLVALNANHEIFSPELFPGNKWVGEILRTFENALVADERQRPQDHVSTRVTPQSIYASTRAIENLLDETSLALATPSGNPLARYTARNGTDVALASGTFCNPSLTIATSGVVEALLMLGWLSVQRSINLLSPRHLALLPAATAATISAEFIQMPKLAMALLESARSRFGCRAFVSGSSTSYGEEDFWSHGANTSIEAKALVAEVEKIAAIEAVIALQIIDPAHPWMKDRNIEALGGPVNATRAVALMKTIYPGNDVRFDVPLAG